VPERNQHSRGYRVNLAVRQDSLNGVWISSEKSSRRLNSRTTVKWRVPVKERNGDEAREKERERKQAKLQAIREEKERRRREKEQKDVRDKKVYERCSICIEIKMYLQ